MKVLLAVFLAVWVSASEAQVTEVFRYKDSQGNWRFSDKKPRETSEAIQFKQSAKAPVPDLGLLNLADGRQQVYANNPTWAPVRFQLHLEDQTLLETLVAPRSRLPLVHDGQPLYGREALRYKYFLGDPTARFDGAPLRIPVPNRGKFRVSQSFGGAFSHTSESSYHAVDIAMQVGDDIVAARDGTVVTVKDDYHMGGQTDYFLDKANLVRVLHSDGSFAVYGHILLGSAEVVPGDRVVAGQKLARCGSSGFSTGPHLHFVVQLAGAKQWRSVPFQFENSQGIFTPSARQWLSVE